MRAHVVVGSILRSKGVQGMNPIGRHDRLGSVWDVELQQNGHPLLIQLNTC